MAAEAAAAMSPPGRRASVDSTLSDYTVELLQVEKSVESIGLSLAPPIDQQQRQDLALIDLDELHPTTDLVASHEAPPRELWQGGVRLVIEAPIRRVWEISSARCGVPRWMPMIEECEEIYPGDADEGSGIGSLRMIRGDILPRMDGVQSWAVEKLVEFDDDNYYYTYEVESSNMGLEGYRATFQLNDFGDNTTLVSWEYEVLAMEDSSQEGMADYMGMFFKACIRRLEAVVRSYEPRIKN